MGRELAARILETLILSVAGRPGMEVSLPDLSPCVVGRPMVGAVSSKALESLNGATFTRSIRYLAR